MTGTANGNGAKIGTVTVKQGLAQMLKGGVIVSILEVLRNGWTLTWRIIKLGKSSFTRINNRLFRRHADVKKDVYQSWELLICHSYASSHTSLDPSVYNMSCQDVCIPLAAEVWLDTVAPGRLQYIYSVWKGEKELDEWQYDFSFQLVSNFMDAFHETVN